MKNGFYKIAAATPPIKVGDCAGNAETVLALINKAAGAGVKLVCFPELCITGYTCGDLFLQHTLLQGAEAALKTVLAGTAGLDVITVIGVPVLYLGKLYNCAAVTLNGVILGLVPKTNIPNYTEFYEARWFTPAAMLGTNPVKLRYADQDTLLGSGMLFTDIEDPRFCLGVEICEDVWVCDTPSTRLCAGGATIIANPSASDEIVSKADWRRLLLAATSGRLTSGYIYADAGWGESSTDLVYSGHNLIVENGTVLAESRWTTGLTVSEIDVERISHERQRMSTFCTAANSVTVPFRFRSGKELTQLSRRFAPNPFVPSDRDDRNARCAEILRIAAQGLAKRLQHTNASSAVIGLSGGLDSTLAILISTLACDLLGWGHEKLLAVTMPCFGTTDRTRDNACILADELGAQLKIVDIGEAVKVHFADIGQNMEDHSVTFENGQARERTQVLMDLANKTGGLVIGTGDLSELALGWATYNGDHMSMYAVNASIPKTLVRYLVSFVSDENRAKAPRLSAVLDDILATPVSPELLPPSADGKIAQKTEDLVGPYELHDFFLYYALRWGFGPEKIYRLAKEALAERYSEELILKWLKVFFRRFFNQQFKRSCLPDGPKVGTVTLSPRGDWRMPSDAVYALWAAELNTL